MHYVDGAVIVNLMYMASSFERINEQFLIATIYGILVFIKYDIPSFVGLI